MCRERSKQHPEWEHKRHQRRKAEYWSKCRDCGVKKNSGVKWASELPNPDNIGWRESICAPCFMIREAKSKEGLKAARKRSRDKRKEKDAILCKAWATKHAVRLRIRAAERAKINRAKNPEKYRAIARRWAENNRDKRAAQFLKWRLKNVDAMRHKNRMQRAQKRAAITPESVLVTKEWFLSLCSDLGQKCYYCYSGAAPLTEDHIIPLAQGGKHVRENIIPACKSCNSRKSDFLISEWRPWVNVPLYGLDLASA